MTTGWPAMTMREAVQATQDIEDLQCWGPGVECWCGSVHAEGMAGLAVPPWERTGEGTT